MILVLGTGRSGTSCVANLLHTQLGVDMGEPFTKSPSSPVGHNTESAWFRLLNIRLQAGAISPAEWMSAVQTRIRGLKEPWGLKDPRLTEHLDLALALLHRPILIWCDRPKEPTVRSMVRHFYMTHSAASHLYDTKRDKLQRTLQGRPHLRVDMGRQWEEKALSRVLTSYLQQSYRRLET